MESIASDVLDLGRESTNGSELPRGACRNGFLMIVHPHWLS